MKEELKKIGHGNDQAMIKIMEFFQTAGRSVNKNELTLIGFKKYRKAQRDYVPFATETIGRKARLLAELGLLKATYKNGYTYYSYEGTSCTPVEKQKYFIRDREGNRIQVV